MFRDTRRNRQVETARWAMRARARPRR